MYEKGSPVQSLATCTSLCNLVIIPVWVIESSLHLVYFIINGLLFCIFYYLAKHFLICFPPHPHQYFHRNFSQLTLFYKTIVNKFSRAYFLIFFSAMFACVIVEVLAIRLLCNRRYTAYFSQVLSFLDSHSLHY